MLNKYASKSLLILSSVILASCGNGINSKPDTGIKDISLNETSILDIDGLVPYNQAENAFKIKWKLSDYDEHDNEDDHEIEDDNSKKVLKQIEDLKEHYPKLTKINDVILTDTGKSILGDNSPESIKPDYAGKDILLELRGDFKVFPILNIDAISFDYANDLINQSVVGYKPVMRLLLDESILFKTISVSSKIIKIKINTKFTPDFYLKGMHKLSFQIGHNYSESVYIKIGDPVPTTNLSPKINSIEVVNGENKKPLNLKLKGQNFMMNYRFLNSKINSVIGFGHQTNIFSNGSYETIVHIPDPEKFNTKDKHILTYSTPFGTSFKVF